MSLVLCGYVACWPVYGSTLVCLSFARDVGLVMFGGLFRADAHFLCL